MLKAILIAVIVAALAIPLYRTYLKAGDKAGNWQVKTLELSRLCGAILADKNRTKADIQYLNDKVTKLAWKTRVSGDLVSGVVKAATPYDQEVITAGNSLDACVKNLESAA